MTVKSPPSPKQIVLVGVSGVGKTTLGAMAAQQLGLPFADIDAEFEKANASDVDTLQRRLGERGYDHQLLMFFARQLQQIAQTVFAAPPRLAHYADFWSITEALAISICLCGEPMEIYMRQDMFEGDRRLTAAEKDTPQRKAQFLDYYHWRQQHCLRAAAKVQIVGNRDRDATMLCGRIRSLLNQQ
jgi:XRE family aerobic/anaerobic benzoate catabolism transcriptional regulator